jgi:hypothetical protein
LQCEMQASRRFLANRVDLRDRAVFAFRALANGRGQNRYRITLRRGPTHGLQHLAETIKPRMQVAWRLCCAIDLRLDGQSTDVIGADEADQAEARIELLQAVVGAARRQLGVPGDLNGILVVEDEEHRGFLGPDPPAFVV